MAKTTVNNFNKRTRDFIQMLCENYDNIINDKNKYHGNKSICKILNDFDENTKYIDQISKYKYK